MGKDGEIQPNGAIIQKYGTIVQNMGKSSKNLRKSSKNRRHIPEKYKADGFWTQPNLMAGGSMGFSQKMWPLESREHDEAEDGMGCP